MKNDPRSCERNLCVLLYRVVLFLNYLFVLPCLQFLILCQSCDVIFPPKNVEIENTKTYDFFVKVLPSCKVWVQTNRKCKNSSYALLCVLYAHPTLTVSWSRILCKLHQARAVIPKLNRVFSLLGIPMVLGSDSGPPLDEQTFLNFSKYLGFKQMRKTAKNPLANTEAEEFSRRLRSSTTYAK